MVDTDYEGYMIIYMCNEVGLDMMEEIVYIEVRDPNITQEEQEKLLAVAQEKITDQMTKLGGE